MLIHHIFILLLSWRCARAIEDEESPPEGAFDQIATASESLRVSFIQSDNSPSLSGSSENSSTKNRVEAATIRYENSNGFVPMTSIDRTASKTSKVSNITAISVYDNTDESSVNVRELGLLENDPAYSTEARMFLNLAGPGADRRSFDSQDGQGEFELLKVNNETPAIANYHEFYENLQSNLNRNRAGTQERYEQPKQPGTGRTIEQNKRTKERIKNIEKYLTNYRDDQEQENPEPYKQYYNNFATGNARPTSKQKEIFEPEKVQTNFHQQSGSLIYDTYGENPVRQRTSSMLRSNYDDNGTSSRQKLYASASTKNRHSKPVVVVEPSDYKLDAKYGSQQAVMKASNIDNYRNRKHREESKVELGNRYDAETHVNREDRYDNSYERSEDIGEYSEEGDYLEITEKPRRVHKSRRRPYTSENSRRLPKEHRGHATDNLEPDDSRKNNSPTRAKLHRPKAKPSYWAEDDRGPFSEENTDEVPEKVRQSVTSKPDDKSPKQNHNPKGANSWSQVGPNIEVSQSNGFEVGQVDKPNILVPVNLNLVPVPNFDHSSALGNGQGFDFTNIPNLVTAAPIVSSAAPVMSTSQSIISSSNANSANSAKNMPIQLNNNYGLSTAVPSDIIVGHSTFQSPVQAVILPQMNSHNKLSTNFRSHYAPSTLTPMFAVTRTLNPSLQNIGPTVASIPSSQTPNPFNHNLHHLTPNPVSPTVPQFLLPQTTIETFPMLHSPYNGNSNYNIFVNPNGLHGQNLIHNGNANSQSTPMQNSQPSSTTPQPNSIANSHLHGSDSQIKKNTLPNSNGQFVATASFSVGNGGQQQHHHQQQQHQQQQHQQQQSQQLQAQQQQQPSQSQWQQPQQQLQGNNVPIDGKLYFPSNNQNGMNNHNYYNGNQYNPQVIRPQHDNVYQIYRDNSNSNGKTYMQTAQVVPAIIHSGQGIPIHFNNRNYANIDEQLQEQQSISNPSIVAHGPRDQNQQILKAANDIFENTWKQLQQLQNNGDAAKKLPHPNIYKVNDNFGSTSNTNTHATNVLSGVNVNSAKAHLPMLPTHNVEIINPNMKPSPVDLTVINPYDTLHHYPAAVITTPIPIFTTTTSFLAPRPAVTSTTPETINLHNYVDTLTQIGAQPSNQVNKLEVRPGVINQDNQRPIFNPINFIPNVDVIKSQSMLNSKVMEPLPNQLNLVPVIPGGNFFKNTYGAQTELIQKPRLSSDLEKYAEEMVKESLKTIYSTQKWNNDRRLRGNYSAAELNELAKLKSELQRFKASLPDPKYNGKDILEAHHSETKVRTAEPSSSQPAKKPELSIADIEQLFKSDFKLNPPGSGESSHHGSQHKTRPGNGRLNDFRNLKQLSDYLTPPKPNSFVSKSPFIDSPIPAKKRPGSTSSRYNSNNGNPRFSRPSSSASRPASGSDAAASNNLESGVRPDGYPRHEKYKYRPGQYSRENNDSNEPSRHSSDHSDYRSYPSFTTSAPPESDSFRPSSNDQSSKTDYYDINHPRMHNLLGLLMKNKQLPAGSSQSYFRDEDDLKQYFANEKRRIQSQFNDESTSFQKKYDTPIDMGPPNSPQVALVRYYSGRRA